MPGEARTPSTRASAKRSLTRQRDAVWIIAITIVGMAGLPALRGLGDHLAGPQGSERFVLVVLWATGLVLAVGFACLARPVLARRRARYARSVAVAGTVIRSGAEDHESRGPLLGFTDAEGQLHEVASAWPGQRRRAGAIVVIRYDPSDPSWAVAEGRDPGILMSAVAVAGCLSLSCFPLGLLLLRG